jgi:hypothetical protein
MGIRIQYRTLCTAHLWHDFALARGESEFAALDDPLQERILANYSIHEWLRISPTQETRGLLERHRLRFIRRPTGFMIAGSVRESTTKAGKYQLQIALPDDFILRFIVELIQPSFLFEANLAGQASSSSVYLFSNRSGNDGKSGLHLTGAVPDYDPAQAYEAGDFAVHEDVLMEASEDVPPSQEPAEGKWMDLPARRYDADREYEKDELAFHDDAVFKATAEGKLEEPPHPDEWTPLYKVSARSGVSAADSVVCVAREKRFPLDKPSSSVKLTVRDGEGQIVLGETQFRRDGNLLEDIRLGLPEAAPGLYTLEALDADEKPVSTVPGTIYLHPDDGGRMPFAVIELSNPAGAFRLFDGTNHLQGREYHIRFRHRRAFWRYIFHGETASLPLNGAVGDLVQENPAQYATTRPWPLNAGVAALKKFGANRVLPQPLPDSIRKENKKLYAETYLVT